MTQDRDMVMKPGYSFHLARVGLAMLLLACCSGLLSRSHAQETVPDGPDMQPIAPVAAELPGTTPAIIETEPLTGGFAPVSTQDLSGKVMMTDAYQIGPGDVLSYDVYLSPDLSEGKIRVGEDGRASFKGVGEVDALGLTIPELQARLTDRLSSIIRNPMVTVGVVETKPGVVYLVGAFKNPGMYEFSTQQQADGEQLTRARLNLSNILANAGGVMMNADLSHIEIRRADGSEKRIVNYWDVLRNGASAEDLMLRAGDVVTVPELGEDTGSFTATLDEEAYSLLLNSPIGPKTIPVRVSGDVKTPGLYELKGTSPYLNSALTMAGGLEDTSNQTKLEIRRNVGNGQLMTMYVDPSKMDITLRPNDMVVVLPKKLSSAATHGGMVRDIMSPLSQLTAPIFSVLFLLRQ